MNFIDDTSFNPNTISVGDNTIHTYTRKYIDANGSQLISNIPTAPIEEYVVVATEAIPKNHVAKINFAQYNTAFKLISIYIDSDSTEDSDILFKVYKGNNLLFYFDLDDDEVPYHFPLAIITPDLNIEIESNSNNIKGSYVYLQPVRVLKFILPDSIQRL